MMSSDPSRRTAKSITGDSANDIADAADNRTITVHMPIRLKRRGGRKQIIYPDGRHTAAVAKRPDTSAWPRTANPTLVRSLVQAFRWQARLDDGICATITEIARAEKLDPSFVSRTIKLTLLAPDIVEAILDGTEPDHVQRQRMLHQPHVLWAQQARS